MNIALPVYINKSKNFVCLKIKISEVFKEKKKKETIAALLGLQVNLTRCSVGRTVMHRYLLKATRLSFVIAINI